MSEGEKRRYTRTSAGEPCIDCAGDSHYGPGRAGDRLSAKKFGLPGAYVCPRHYNARQRDRARFLDVAPCAVCQGLGGASRTPGARPFRFEGDRYGYPGGKLCHKCAIKLPCTGRRPTCYVASVQVPVTPAAAQREAARIVEEIAARGREADARRMAARYGVAPLSPRRAGLAARKEYRATIFGREPGAWVEAVARPIRQEVAG